MPHLMLDLDRLDFSKGQGFVTVVTQDAVSGAVLMVARADREALERTIATGEMHYHSRSRGLWRKGETSGNRQFVVALLSDCDGDTILARVNPAGPACHTGADTCFGDLAEVGDVLTELDATVARRMAELGEATASDRASYTQRLLADRNLRLKKIGEEAAELITACADTDRERAAEEAADLIYHALVALRAAGGGLSDVRRVLAARRAARRGSRSE